MDQKIHSQVDLLFQHSRVPNIRQRTEEIKHTALAVANQIEQELTQLSHSRAAQIRSLASSIAEKEKRLHSAIQGFKNQGQNMIASISSDNRLFHDRSVAFTQEAEQRKKRLAEASAARHQQLNQEVAQILNAVKSQIESSRSSSTSVATNQQQQQPQQQQQASVPVPMTMMMNFGNSNNYQQQQQWKF